MHSICSCFDSNYGKLFNDIPLFHGGCTKGQCGVGCPIVIFPWLDYHRLEVACDGVCWSRWKSNGSSGNAFITPSDSFGPLDGGRFEAWEHRMGSRVEDFISCRENHATTSRHTNSTR